MGEVIDLIKAKLLRKQRAEAEKAAADAAAIADYQAKTQQIADVLNRWAEELKQEAQDESDPT